MVLEDKSGTVGCGATHPLSEKSGTETGYGATCSLREVPYSGYDDTHSLGEVPYSGHGATHWLREVRY
eukprot:698955-Rhodomonas_salina.1